MRLYIRSSGARGSGTQLSAAAIALTLALSSCATSDKAPATAQSERSAPAASTTSPATTREPKQPTSPPGAARAVFRPAAWNELPGWRNDDASVAWAAFVSSCAVLAKRETWREACANGMRLLKPSAEAARQYFETNFSAYRVSGEDSDEEGLMTGYYEPLLRGSRRPTTRYRYPLYGVPDDLVIVDLGDVYPELKNMRLRGRLEGRRLVPYYDRAQIESAQAPLRGREIAWVDDPVELFFLHIQGSGRLLLDSGQTIRVGYADQNGYPYRSIGRVLVERGELALDQASMQGIQTWARQNPAKVNELLNTNASYVFFRESPDSAGGPVGSLGVPLTPRRSIAVDSRYIPLGAPVFVSTTWPNSNRIMNRLVLAQDTGGAIRGAVRADFFWGYGEAAAREAGRMKERLRMWMLWPRGQQLPATAGLQSPG